MMATSGRRWSHDAADFGADAVRGWLWRDDSAIRPSVDLAFAPPVSPNKLDEIRFLTGLNADGTLASAESYWSDTSVTAFKFGASTAGTAATVRVYLAPSSNFTATEQATIAKGLAAWAAIADIQFTTVTSGNYDLLFQRGNDGRAFTHQETSLGSGSTLGHYTAIPYVQIDTSSDGFSLSGSFTKGAGYGLATIIHEIGHALGLGHGGNYNFTVDPATQQYSAYDDRMWTTMSYLSWTNGATRKYIDSYPVTGTNWGTAGGVTHSAPQTPMMLDILAAQQLYGVSTHSPFTGGQVYGFNCNVSGALHDFYDFTVNAKPVLTLYNQGQNNTLDCSGYADKQTISLVSGTFSSIGGLTNNVAIAGTTSITRAIGGSGNDTITGSYRADTIDGGAGDDRLFGGSNGPDALIGGSGIDTVDFTDAGAAVTASLVRSPRTQAGAFSFASGFGTATGTLSGIENITGSAYGDTLSGDEQNNRIDGAGGRDVMIGGLGDDTYLVNLLGDDVREFDGGGRDKVLATVSFTLPDWVEDLTLVNQALNATGNAMANTLVGNNYANTLSGMGGDDTIQASFHDTADGGEGLHDRVVLVLIFDTVVTLADSGDGGVFIPLSNETTIILRGIEDVTGTDHDDTIYGNVADNILDGGKGDDLLRGGGGVDTLNGGAGIDTADYSDAVGPIGIAIDGAGNGSVSLSGLPNETITGIENLTGGAYRDTLIGNFQANVIHGGDGSDTIYGGGGIHVTGVPDQYDMIYGEGGDDYLDGAQYLMKLFGGDGNDLFGVKWGVDCDGGTGTDTATFEFLNTLNLVVDLSATDADGRVTYQLKGGLQSVGSVATGTLIAIENLVGTSLDDRITGDAGANDLRGDGGNDRVDGGDGRDIVWGGVGDDVLLGGGAVDQLIGGTGKDDMTGGAGGDRFVFTGDDLGTTSDTADLIRDFGVGADRIDLRDIDAIAGTNKNDAFTFIGSSEFDGHAGQLRFAVIGTTTLIFADVDGDMHVDFTIALQGAHTLQSADFLL